MAEKDLSQESLYCTYNSYNKSINKADSLRQNTSNSPEPVAK